LRVSTPLAVRVKDLKVASVAQPREDMRDRAALMVAALRADMVEGRAVGHVDSMHLVEPRRRRAVFQHGQVGARSTLTTWCRIASESLVVVQVDQADGLDALPWRGSRRHRWQRRC
jgi:hypothetical protein